MSSLRRSVRGLSALLASLSLLGSGSVSLAAGKHKKKVDVAVNGGGDASLKGSKKKKKEVKGKNKGDGRKKEVGDKEVVSLFATPTDSSVRGEILGFAKKTRASFSEMSTLAKVAGVVGIGESVSILSTSRGLVERLAVQLEAAVRKLFDKNVKNIDDLAKVDPDVAYDVNMQIAFLEDPIYAPIRPLINLFMWGKNIIPDRFLAFLAGKQNKGSKKEYCDYAFEDYDGVGKYLLKWKPTFINRLLYKLGQYFGEEKKEKEDPFEIHSLGDDDLLG